MRVEGWRVQVSGVWVWGLAVCLRMRGGLVFKAHRLVYHSTLGLRVIKKKDAPKTIAHVFTGHESSGPKHVRAYISL